MSRTAEVITVISTFGCAIGIGFMMQSGDVADARYASGELTPLTSANLVGRPVSRVSSYDFITSRPAKPFEVRSITHTSAGIPTPKNVAPAELLVRASAGGMTEDQAENSGLLALDGDAGDCPIRIDAEPADAAMVLLSVSAPCFADQEITFSHNGLLFAEKLSVEGQLSFLLPALSENAQIAASFPNGRTEVAEAQVDTAVFFNRVIVQWHGDAGVQLHAREMGSDYGEEGHVWSGSARDVSAISRGVGGYLTVLGDPNLPDPMRAEVYTFPSVHTQTGSSVNLTVEAEVTTENCGKRIQAAALQFNAGKRVSAQELLLSMPDCGAVGRFLVLNNLLQNLTVASK